MSTVKIAVTLLVGLALVLGVSQARAETVNSTPVTSLPAVISAQGVHCLTNDLNTAITSGSAILISANNVVLDLNGFKLGGLAAGTGTAARGIFAANRQNITIKNGTTRGFYFGILLQESTTSQGRTRMSSESSSWETEHAYSTTT